MKFAYLNLEEQPRGNHMLHGLVKAGFVPSLVIEESSKLARKGRRSLLEQIERISPERPLPPSLHECLSGHEVPCLTVSNHNDDESERALRAADIDLIVLGDTRIIKPHIMEIPARGTVNVHPGLLPDVRGNNPYIWAIIHDLPQGCTVHFIDEDIDTGPIIIRRELRVEKGLSFPHLLAELNELCSTLLVEAMRMIAADRVVTIEQRASSRATFRLAPEDIKRFAVDKLEQGFYTCSISS